MKNHRNILWAAILATLLATTFGVSTASAANNDGSRPPAPSPSPSSENYNQPAPTTYPPKEGVDVIGDFMDGYEPLPTTEYVLIQNRRIRVILDGTSRVGERKIKMELGCPAFTGDLDKVWFPEFYRNDNISDYNEEMAKVVFRWKPVAKELWLNKEVGRMFLSSKVIILHYEDYMSLDFMAEQAVWLDTVVRKYAPCRSNTTIRVS